MINLDELERRAMACADSTTKICVVSSLSIVELITRLRQAEKDAARYRWLRDESAFTHNNAPLVLFTDCNGDAIIFNSGCVLHDEDLDKAIDEAMQCK